MYTDVTTLVDDIITIYDSTEVSTLQIPETRRARIVHYLQRTAENVWFHRAWPFAMAVSDVTMEEGVSGLPEYFGRVSGEGGLYDRNGVPWVEIAYQDMIYLRGRKKETNAKLFSIGGDIQIPNYGSTETFTFVYQTAAPIQALDGGTGFPETFGEVLLLGTVMKLKEEEGDARQIWRQDFQAALARVGTLYVKASRTQRMPQTVGGMW